MSTVESQSSINSERPDFNGLSEEACTAGFQLLDQWNSLEPNTQAELLPVFLREVSYNLLSSVTDQAVAEELSREINVCSAIMAQRARTIEARNTPFVPSPDD